VRRAAEVRVHNGRWSRTQARRTCWGSAGRPTRPRRPRPAAHSDEIRAMFGGHSLSSRNWWTTKPEWLSRLIAHRRQRWHQVPHAHLCRLQNKTSTAHYAIKSLVRPPDIPVGGLVFYYGFFLLFSFFLLSPSNLRAQWTRLNENLWHARK